MSSGFFIRKKRKLDSTKSKPIKKSRTLDSNKNGKQKKPVKYNEEISSSEELSDIESNVSYEDDEEPTAQEKKLQIAKKYIEEIEKQERERLENGEVSSDVLANRVQEDILDKAGRLRKKVADKLVPIQQSDVHVLRNKHHNLSVTCVVISSDNKYLYSASKDCCIIKWDVLLKQKIKSVSSVHKQKDKTKIGHDAVIISLAISHDSRFLVSGDVKSVIHVWNPDTLLHIHSFKGHKGPITGLSICRDSNNLYSSSGDRSVKVWSLEEKMYIETLFGHQSPATNIDVLLKDRAVSCGGIDNSIRVWKIQEESQLVFNGSGRVIDMVRRLDDSHFISSGEDGLVCIWGISKKKPLHVITNAHELDVNTKEPNWVVSVAALQSTDVFATGSSNGVVKIWKTEENYKSASLLFTVPVKGFINSMTFSINEQYLILGVGQEHKLGRWTRISEAKNSIVIIKLQKKNEVCA